MTTDTKRLRELAQSATPGPWSQVDTPWGDGTWVCTGTGDPHGQMPIADCEMHCHEDEYNSEPRVHDNAAFIAAANPQAVLGLLDEVERLRRERDEATRYMESNEAEYGKLVEYQRERMREMSAMIDRQQCQIADDSRTLAAMTAARDEACDLAAAAVDQLDDINNHSDEGMQSNIYNANQRISALRLVGTTKEGV
jgi:hypothetical protein